MLEPVGTPLHFEYQDGEIHVIVPRVEIYEVFVEAN